MQGQTYQHARNLPVKAAAREMSVSACVMNRDTDTGVPPPRSIMVRECARGAEAGVRPPTTSLQRRKNGRFALLGLALMS